MNLEQRASKNTRYICPKCGGKHYYIVFADDDKGNVDEVECCIKCNSIMQGKERDKQQDENVISIQEHLKVMNEAIDYDVRGAKVEVAKRIKSRIKEHWWTGKGYKGAVESALKELDKIIKENEG